MVVGPEESVRLSWIACWGIEALPPMGFDWYWLMVSRMLGTATRSVRG
jgi:hypothetical protein